MTTAETYRNLILSIKEAHLLQSCAELLGWDERTYMPSGGSAHRAEQLALLARIVHQKATSPKIGDQLGELENSKLVASATAEEAVNVREIRRAYDRAVKMPSRLVEEIARTTTRAQQIWSQARSDDDFATFQPWLDKIVQLKREEAQAVGYRKSPYDALLDEYEPGATTAEITKTFAALRKDLVPLVEAITRSPKQPNRDIIHRTYPVDQQRQFGKAAATAIGFDFDSGRLDETVHPFCAGIGPGDCRLTTRYDANHFNSALFGTLHEAGHGIYDQGLDPDHFGTPRGTYISLGIHESQSRLWENQVGRSRPFWEHFFPKAQQAFPDALTNTTLDDFVFAINDVQRSFIRVEADEVTYNLHIILRFEMEQALIGGDLQAKDVPGAWNKKFQDFFGMKPPTDREGCLQDVHWSGGGIGYFPTYTLGNLYSAQFMEQARQELGDLDADLRRGEFGRLKSWLNEKIHKPGQTYRAGALCERVTGKPLDHGALMKYLRGKYGALYNV